MPRSGHALRWRDVPRQRRRQDRPTLLLCVGAALAEGVASHIPRHASWELLLCRPDELSFVTDNCDQLGLIGAVFHLVEPATIRALLPASIPKVLIECAPQQDCHVVGSDGIAIGELAYRSLRARGFRNFGFWGVPSYWASDLRQVGFAGMVARSQMHLHPGTRPPLGTFMAVMESAMAWLRAAPKPMAVFTDNSQRALEILWAARLGGLQVPDQVAILSGAEDPLLCTLNAPGLSAIDTDIPELGRAAARLLDEQLGGRQGARRTAAPPQTLVAPRRLIVRRSTETLAEVPAPVAAGLACIRTRAHLGISVQEVVRASGRARRTLELAFRTSLDRSISEEIALARVARVRELLETTRLPLTMICARTGISDPSQLCRLFTRHVGQGPRVYRLRHGLPGRQKAGR